MTTAVSISAGETYAVLGIVTVSVATLGGLIWLGRRSGVTAQKVADTASAAAVAAAEQATVVRGSDAAANAPATDADVTAAFLAGKE